MKYEFKAKKADYNRIIKENPDSAVILVPSRQSTVMMVHPDFIARNQGKFLLGDRLGDYWGFPSFDEPLLSGYRGWTFNSAKYNQVKRRIAELIASDCNVVTPYGTYKEKDNIFNIIRDYGEHPIIFITKDTDPNLATLLISPRFSKRCKGREFEGIKHTYPHLYHRTPGAVFSGTNCEGSLPKHHLALPKGWKGICVLKEDIEQMFATALEWESQPIPRLWKVEAFGRYDAYSFKGVPDFKRIIRENPDSQAIILRGGERILIMESPKYMEKAGRELGWPGVKWDEGSYWGSYVGETLPDGWTCFSHDERLMKEVGGEIKRVCRRKMCTVTTLNGEFRERLDFGKICQKYGGLVFITPDSDATRSVALYSPRFIKQHRDESLFGWKLSPYIGFPSLSKGKVYYGSHNGTINLPKGWRGLLVPTSGVKPTLKVVSDWATKPAVTKFTVETF